VYTGRRRAEAAPWRAAEAEGDLVEALVLVDAAEAKPDWRRQAIERLIPHAGRAWQLAFRATGSADAAEDAVQQAYLIVLGKLPAGKTADEETLWFFQVAANEARMQLRGDQRRRHREAGHMIAQSTVHAGTEPADELVAALRRALMELDEKYRMPVALCCEQGFSKREAAAILSMPESTVSKYVGAGLERLRESLKKAGHSAAPAVVVGGLAHTAPSVPATLVATLEKLLSTGTVDRGRSVAATKGAARRGIAMKAIAGVVVAGALAGIVGLVGSNRPLSSAPPAAMGGPLVLEHFAFVLPDGYLNGPRKEAMDHRAGFGPAEADAKGNIYGMGSWGGVLIRCIRADGQVETITGEDYYMADFKLTEGPASALGTPPRSFTYGLNAFAGLLVEGVPSEGEGKGQLLCIMNNQVFKVWKNAEKGNRWWFKRIIGGGKTKLPQARGQSVPALDAELAISGCQLDKEHKLVIWTTAGSGYRYDGEKLNCFLSKADYQDKALKTKNGPVGPGQFFLAADGAVYLGYYFTSDAAFKGDVAAIWRLSPDGSKAEPFAKSSRTASWDGDALTEAHFFCGPHFSAVNSAFGPPEIFLTAAHDEATVRRVMNGRTSRLCLDGEWREVPGQGGKLLLFISGPGRAGPGAIYGSKGSGGSNHENDHRMYMVRGIDFSKPTKK
jgi:RNA polymerase sigma factor (sigma-70 family)